MREGHIPESGGSFAHFSVFGVLCHTDDGVIGLTAAGADEFAERVLVAEVEPREGLVDDGHFRRRGCIGIREFASGNQRDPQSREIIAADGVAVGTSVIRRRCEAGNDNPAAPRSARDQPLPSEGGGLNSRKGPDLLDDLGIEARQAFGRVAGGIESDLQELVGPKADIDAAKVVERADEKTRACQQDQRNCHLNAHHDFSAREAADMFRVGTFQARRECGSRRLQSGRKPEPMLAARATAKLNASSIAIRSDGERRVVPVRDDQGKQDSPQSVCDQQGGSPAEDAQKQAFGQQLANEADSAGADRKPDGEFMRAGGCSREQEMSDVHARQQEHGGDHGGQDPDGALVRPPLRRHFLERRASHAGVRRQARPSSTPSSATAPDPGRDRGAGRA